MMVMEKLDNKNIDDFNQLLKEARSSTPYRMNFHEYYDSQSLFARYFLKKLVKLIKVNNEYIGYIWLELPSTKATKISDIYLREDYIKYLNEKVPLVFKSNLVIYEGFENIHTINLVKSMKMNRIRLTNLMMLKTDDFKINKRITNATFTTFIKRKDEELRCKVQNLIFNDDNRTPLTIDDIKYDIKQDYYINDLCIFIKVKNKVIGYGQIIFNRDINLVVNFGIIDGYRNQGYGKDLIIKLIEIAKEKGINEIYIRVDYNNLTAKKLYYDVGFREVGNLSTWLWAKELL